MEMCLMLVDKYCQSYVAPLLQTNGVKYEYIIIMAILE